jgi:hypothetical protein
VAVIAGAAIVAGMVLALTAGSSSTSHAASAGPYVFDFHDSSNPHNADSHWHAALGVYDCGHWLGDRTGTGIWLWPNVATVEGQSLPGRAGTNVYAGLHSHDDGIMHMEPATFDDAGANATVGRYFGEGGWQLSANAFTFLATSQHNGDRCGASVGQISWFVNGKTRSGNPGSYKLYDGDVVVIAFEQGDAYPGSPPSAANLPIAQGRSPAVPTTEPVRTLPKTSASAAGKPCVPANRSTPNDAPPDPVPPGQPPSKLVTRDLDVVRIETN